MDVSQLAQIVRANIVQALEERSISRNELSRRTGISQGSVVKLLNRDHEIQTDTIQKIADALSIPVTDLTTDHSTSSPKRSRTIKAAPAA